MDVSVSAPLAREERVGAIVEAATINGEKHFVGSPAGGSENLASTGRTFSVACAINEPLEIEVIDGYQKDWEVVFDRKSCESDALGMGVVEVS